MEEEREHPGKSRTSTPGDHETTIGLAFFPHLCLCLFNVAFLPKLKEGFQNSSWVDIGEDKTCWKFQVLQMMP